MKDTCLHIVNDSLFPKYLLIYFSLISFQVVGGPNERTDYHVNQTPEWFYQLEGHMTLKVVDSCAEDDTDNDNDNSINNNNNASDHGHSRRSVFRDITINQGDIFLLPANVPHNPVRYKDTIGIVVEQDRPKGLNDAIQWYCPNLECRSMVYRKEFYMSDLGVQVKEAIEEFRNSGDKRCCTKCGTFVKA